MYKEYPRFKPEEVLEYSRKSRSDDPLLTVEEVLAKHSTILKEWADRNLDAPIPKENIYHEVVSGETIQARPQFKNLLRRIESPQIKAVLIVECERLGRPDLEEIGRISKLFQYTNTLVITLNMTYNLNNKHDRKYFEQELLRGNDFLEYIKEIQNRGRRKSYPQSKAFY